MKVLGEKRTYIHDQGMPSDVWTINHTLGKYPSVSVVDSANSIVTGEVTYLSKYKITVTFTSGFSGKAYLN
jgi:hypothetical protein